MEYKNGGFIETTTISRLRGGGKYLIYTTINEISELDNEIQDYKFFCFNGEPLIQKVDFGRFIEHHANYYDSDWNLLPFGETDFPPVMTKKILPPPNFQTMVDLARKLSKGKTFLRVDFYNIVGKIYFGELTFFPASGTRHFSPIKWDLKVGDMLDITQRANMPL